ncbi:hypothetical protein GLOIN_2v1817146 [Rhizophagus irregularis DAOM 181602=DAOM 197198]|nr:hypothetical protein GLOIN_2v1817146 [Rhizophagus irregularis DAOM 181602=DAOM 197198]POG60143.1 hypothetical protein GLOIN_2v1817146 [Rhizophagus irregularis DAOM 181602=DAOM 197198]|eukprot:XP_025167009.1 hypothetical protein GLOIN_2v1817146 [Rhizophagus irregularis DAOM 181602=DAOM 197198]
MKHSFFYDAYLMDRNIIQQIDNTDYKDHKESFREDDYEPPQTLLQLMIRNIQNEVNTEIWEVKPELSQTKSYFVILMADGSHSCTCNLLISFGIPCRHFYKVLRKSLQAKFHISLINQCWYQDLKLSITDQELALLEVLSIVKDNYTEITAHRDINFDYIHQVRGGYVYTEKLKNIVSVKAKYGRFLGIARKALDLVQKLNCYNELNGLLQMFIDEKQQELLQKGQTIDKENSNDHQRNDESDIICSNPVTLRRRGCPPNRYLSEGETANKNK